MKKNKYRDESVSIDTREFDIEDFANLIDKRDSLVIEYLNDSFQSITENIPSDVLIDEWYDENISAFDEQIVRLGNIILKEKYNIDAVYDSVEQVYSDKDLEKWYKECGGLGNEHLTISDK